jgi:para-nitrobenzyl esterase
MGLAALLLLALVVDATLVVKTQEGIVKGVTLPLAPYLPNSTATADGFLGIPYAEQPERWTPSVKKQPWSGARDASSFGPGCPQVCLLPPGTCPATQSEDCLSLNVYAPSGARQGLAVLVFLPGGRFEQGASDTYLYDGRFLVQSRQIIVVTINYRLGALGFMYTPGGESQGNYGVQDQLLALQWVQRNIAAFGGDPNKVRPEKKDTLFNC